MKNVKIEGQIQHLWFIKELLRKILTIEVVKCFSRKTSQPGISRIWVDEFYRSCSQPPSCEAVIEFFAEIVMKWEVKPFLWICIYIYIYSLEYIYIYLYIYIYIYVYMKAFTLKAIFKTYIQLCSFSKARDIVHNCLKLLTRNHLKQKHLKSGICWKGNPCYPAFSCFTGWSYPGIFFIQTHTLIV